jgi:hypothetical protein
VNDVRIAGCPTVEVCQLFALTLVDEQDDSFQTLVPDNYRLIHSGDVKIYENLDALPRAFLVADWQWQNDHGAILAALQEPDFDPRETLILVPHDTALPQRPFLKTELPLDNVEFKKYLPEEVIMVTDADTDAMLLLTDANYPGWQATIDGQQVPLYEANGLFRAVYVPAGKHEVVFSFKSRSFNSGRLLSLVTLAIVAIILIGLQLTKKNYSV